MANSATVLNSQLPIGYEKSQAGIKTKQVKVVIDTTGADLTVYDPPADKHWAIIGLIYVETNAHTLTIKSQSTTLLDLELAANSGIVHPIGNGVLLTSAVKGDDLIIQSSAAMGTMIFTIQEFDYLRF